MNRAFRQKIVDLVGQCGLPSHITIEVEESAGLGFKKNRHTQVGRYSQPLPFRTVYRITHEPAPPPTDSAKIYINEHLTGIENTKHDFAYHPTIHLNDPLTVYRPRLPILCMKEQLQNKTFEPSTFEDDEGCELPSELSKRRPISARTLNPRNFNLSNSSNSNSSISSPRPTSARTLNSLSLTPLTVHEPLMPLSRAQTARRPNSNVSYHESDDDLDDGRIVTMSKFKTGTIDPELIRKENEKAEIARRAREKTEEPEPDYVEEKPQEEEVKEPPNYRLLYIRKLLRQVMRNPEEEEEEENHEKDPSQENAEQDDATKEEAPNEENNEETANEETPNEETPNEETINEETANEEMPNEETTNEEMPNEETANEEMPNEETTNEETPNEETTNEETANEETTNEENNEETANEETANEETPNEETTNEENNEESPQQEHNDEPEIENAQGGETE